MAKLFSQKKPDKADVTIKHLQERKELLKKIPNKNSMPILSGTFDFDPEEYLDNIYTNAFCIRKDKKQAEKDNIIKVIENIDLQIKKSTNKSRISQLKQYRKELLNRYSSLGETFVDLDDEKTETLDKILDLDRKLASGETKKNASITLERKKPIKKIQKSGWKL